ncbi:MAG: MFS transporter [Haloarculaceae archaeon]
MEAGERSFALVISGAHGMDHLLKRVFPPLVPVFAVAFGFPLWKLGVLLGARSFGSALGQAPMGHLSDRYDRRVMLPAGMALMGVSFLAFAALPTLSVLEFEFTVAGVHVTGQFAGMLVAMVASGIGSSTVHPTGYPLISRNVSPGVKGKVLGMWGSARAFGDGGAPALVGLGLLVAGWQPILAAFGVLGLVYAGYLFVVLGSYETRPADTAGDDGGESSGILRGDRRLYLYPMLVVLVAFVLQLMATAGANVFLPQFINSEYGYTFTLAGFTITPESTASFYYSALLLTAGVVQLGTGELIDRYDNRKVLIGFLAAGALVLVVLATLSFAPLALFAVLLLLGASLWGLNPARDAIVSDIAPPDREGRTFGYLWTGALLISSGSPAVIGYIGDVTSLRQAFLVLAGFVFLSTVPIALLLSDRVFLRADAPEATRAD